MTNQKIKVDLYRLISDAVESGLQGGFMKAHKYADNPSMDAICQMQHNYIMNAICEFISFEDACSTCENNEP